MNNKAVSDAGSHGRSKALRDAYATLGVIRAMAADAKADLQRSQDAIIRREGELIREAKAAEQAGDFLRLKRIAEERDRLSEAYELTVLDPEQAAQGGWPPYSQENDAVPESHQRDGKRERDAGGPGGEPSVADHEGA